MSPWIKVLIATTIACLLIVSFAFTYSLLHREQPKALANESTPSPTPIAEIRAKIKASPSPTPEAAATPEVSTTPTQEAEAHEPEYDWVPKKTVGITLNTLDRLGGKIDIPPGTRVKFEIEADSGINFALASADPSFRYGFDPNTEVCLVTKMFKTEVECIVPSNPLLLIVDGRGVLTAATAIITRGLTAKNAIAQNKVNITLYEWKCANWCN